MKLTDCKIFELPKASDRRGNLTFVEGARHIPFEIKRIFYLYDVPAGESRAGHALKTCQQFIIAASGSFEVIVDDGTARKRLRLDRADCGLYVPPLIWREIHDFAKDSVCLVMASEYYDEADYLDEYSEFARTVGAQKT